MDEIKKVHDDTLIELARKNTLSEESFKSMVHKVKGGAQLLNAKAFSEQCQDLEKDGPLEQRVALFIELLKQQNQVLKRYQDQYNR